MQVTRHRLAPSVVGRRGRMRAEFLG